MDFLHLHGIRFIQWLQGAFFLEPFFIFTSHFGSPLTAYSFLFPGAYYVNPTLGLTTILCAATSEWISGILKWILHGHRPYWWAKNELPHLTKDFIMIKQYPLTCETGPGSPSGHCMVTVAGLVPITMYFYRKLSNKGLYQSVLLSLFCTFVLSLGLSRCYVAAHFPHQVISGIITGLLIGYLFDVDSNSSFFVHVLQIKKKLYEKLNLCLKSPHNLLWIGGISFILAYLFNICLEHLIGIDTNWTLKLAIDSCENVEWIHLSTSLMVSFARLVGYLFGLYFGLRMKPSNSNQYVLGTNSTIVTMLCTLIAFLSTKYLEQFIQHLILKLFYKVGVNEIANGASSIHLFSSFLEASIGPIITIWWIPTLISKLNILIRR